MGWIKTIGSASGENWRMAIKEVVIIACISITPLVLRAVFFWLEGMQNEKPISFGQSLLDHVMNGNLLLFSIANFAAILWLASRDYKDRFEERIYFILFCFVGLGACMFFLGYDADFKNIPIGLLRTIAVTLFIFSIVINIAMLVFQKFSGVDFQNSQSIEEDDTLRNLNARRGQ